MTIAQLFFPITTVALSVALWSCWRSGKPARKLAAEERERKYQAHLAEVKFKKEEQFTKDVLSVLDAIYSGRIESGKRQLYNHDYVYTHPMVQLLQDLKGNDGTIKRILGRADRTHNRLDELSTQICEVHSVLRVYHPRHGNIEALPTIRKG